MSCGVNGSWRFCPRPPYHPRVLAHYALALSPETTAQPPRRHLMARPAALARTLGWDERKVLGWLLLAIVLWATDFWHHISPAAIGVGIGLLLTLPGVGVLEAKAVKAVNFCLIVFAGGVVSMANVLTAAHALTPLSDLIGTWHDTLMSTAWRATLCTGAASSIISGGQ